MPGPQAPSARPRRLPLLVAALAWLGGGACGKTAIPDPHDALRAYAEAAARGDPSALYGLMTTRSQQSLGLEGVRRAVGDARGELVEQSGILLSASTRVQSVARVRFADGEEATLSLENGTFRVSSADALPAGARTPAQALEQLRRVLARRSYAGLLRVLSKETRNAMEHDLRGLVDGLEHPDALEVKIQGDHATVQIQGGHLVRLHREGSTWAVDDFD